MYRTFIFFKSGLTSVSPAVTVWWPGKVINLFNQFPPAALHYGAYATGACADFIVACSAVEKTKYQPVEVENLPLRWDGVDALTAEYDTPAYSAQWREWLFAELGRYFTGPDGPPELPVLVDLDPPHHVTQGGTVLFQRGDHRDHEDGAPLWVTPAAAKRLAAARAAALKRRPGSGGKTRRG